MSGSNLESEDGFAKRPRVTKGNSLSTMDKKLNLLNEKVDKLLDFQEDLTGKLQRFNQEIDDLGKGLHGLSISQTTTEQREGVKKVLKSEDGIHQMDIQSMCTEILKLMRVTYQDASNYREKLEKIEKKPKDKPDEKGAKGKHAPASKGIQAEGKSSLEATKREKKLDERDGACEKVNFAHMVLSKTDSNPPVKEKMAQLEITEVSGQADSSKGCQQDLSAVVQKDSDLPCISSGNPAGSQNMDKTLGLEEHPQKLVSQKSKGCENKVSQLGAPSREVVPSKSGGEVIRTRISINVQMSGAQDKMLKSKEGSFGSKSPEVSAPVSPSLGGEGAKHRPNFNTTKQPFKSSWTDPAQEIKGPKASKKQGQQIFKPIDQLLPVRTEEKVEMECKTLYPGSVTKDSGKDLGGIEKSLKETAKMTKDSMKDGKAELVELDSTTTGRQERRSSQCTGKPSDNAPSIGASKVEEVVIDDSPSPPAPFEHRIVSIKQTELTACYSVCHHEVLGGGRFGQVHKCTEKSTGLCLAAKIIKVKVAKEREEVKNEINIMNQLNHVNLIQLYDAFESKNNLTLIMEYVNGGELFDRITDENYSLTELDAILFTKQICEGIHYLHQHYILHLDLKPENILCVNCTGNQIKIIDFGLARRYKPREKLKVNFGTPEFLAPEVVNYDFVSFPTDMWSIGVIAYMLLSGLSPFLGETDTETMNYIVNCSWDFDAEAFEQVSDEAKDFVSRLLIKEKSGRISAANCLKHEWLTNLPSKAKKSKAHLKSQVLLQRYMAHRKWKKHFYVVAAANRLRRFPSMSENPA
ncbi:myosin light chain kinase 3 isoform X2 [Tiliqua scincoides]|uniref:myosin light chain kinase 3 isoform X2 n=1 Tax=Tiliqua scincoides TaxID=71010 RepID=UPI0034629A84